MSESNIEQLQNMNIEDKEVVVVAEKKAACPKKKQQKKAPKAKKPEEVGGLKELSPYPSYIGERIDLYDKLEAEHDQLMKDRQEKSVKITVTLPDGKQVSADSYITTPYDVARDISQGLANMCIVAKVNGELYDLDRPLEVDSSVELLKFEDDEAKSVYWHSTAHILGEAMECTYGGCLCYGPPIENGFYYDMFMGAEQQVSDKHYKTVETVMKKFIKEKQPFKRLEIKKETLLEMFKYNEFKVRILNEKVKTATTTVYRCGNLIDLCRGPHVRTTGSIKSFMLYKNSATYWEGNQNAETLQRIYGISFPNKKELTAWKTIQDEAKKRDHRKIGKEQELFFFNELSPGSCFFNPKGAFIYNTLMNYIKEQYRVRGFDEVITPNIYNSELWKTSGHWKNYSENMFHFECEKATYGLKPMNCPGHCLMFANRSRSWRELPIRFADFGVLHRNEASGALTGLTRVRRFQQDDAHIFCRQDQIKQEVKGALDFLDTVYTTFGFTYKLYLSTRPEKYMGEISVWDEAERQLTEVLDESGIKWTLNPADGAFYGPKIDIKLEDALRRPHQCGTIQLDFQLPLNFNLSYVTGDGDDKKRPVIVHRAVLGSVERMIAILTESYGGKWPLWLSPRQVMIVPVGSKHADYAVALKTKMNLAKIEVDVNLDEGQTFNKKVRNAQLEQFNFILVVGDKEMESNTVNVRTRDNIVHGETSVDEFISKIQELTRVRSKNAEVEFDDKAASA